MFKDNPKLKNIFLLGFLLSLHLAFTSYINSSFLSASFGENNVSLIYIWSSIISILALFFIPGMLRRLGGYRFLLFFSLLDTFCLFLLSNLKSSLNIIPVFIFYFTVNNLIIFALDELLQIFSKNSQLGRVRGLYLTLINLAWVIAQVVSGKAFLSSSFSALYSVAFFIMAAFFLVAFFSLKNLSDPKYDKALGLRSFRNFFRKTNLTRAYAINFLLQFFYVWMVIYTPIYLYAHLGFSWREISLIFTVMLLPFVLIQFPLGNYSDSIGERKMLMFGFAIAALATLSLFFIKSHDIWVWALLLFSTRIGAAVIEVMSDVYFFKHIERESDEYISVYRNTAPASYVLAPLTAFVIFPLIPSFNFIYLILGTFMLYGIYLASTIRKNDK